MPERSWSLVEPDPPALHLPADLAARDVLGGRDCGWVAPLRPLVRAFCPPHGDVFDPFCGFATTLLAASLEGRAGSGTEIDPARAALARERLARHGVAANVLDGSVAVLPGEARFDLVLTNVPYFGCGWSDAQAVVGAAQAAMPSPGSSSDGLEGHRQGLAARAAPTAASAGQLYVADDYAAWLHGLRSVFHALRPHVAEEGYVVAMVGNTRVGGRVVAQAFDVARILGSLFVPQDERVLCYPPRADASDREEEPRRHGGSHTTDRTHEYVLVYRRQRERIDLAATQGLLRDVREAGFAVEVFGSFATWQADPRTREPADLDLRVPRDAAHFARLFAWLRARGFVLTLWGEPVATPPDLATLDHHGYLRAERHDRSGGRVRVDLVPA